MSGRGPGDIVGERFTLEREVGSGGMGTVYRARDARSGALVALKVLHSTTEVDVARFTREAELLASLEHPAVVRYVAHGCDAEGRRFLAMEWLDGIDLAERLATRGPLDAGETLLLARRLADALATVHAHRLVHRDVKPGNVFLVGEDVARAKLVDFGLARPARGAQLTSEGMVIGTPAYMAPEQVRGEATDPRIDVYGLGCVMFECLSAHAPFGATDLVALLEQVLLEPAPPVRALRPDAPPGLSAFISRLLSKDRRDRPRDGEALRAELHDLDPDRPEPEHAPGPDTERSLASVVVLRHAEPDAASDAAAHALAEQHAGAVHGRIPPGYLLTFGLQESAEEMAVRAARCAMAAVTMPAFAGAALSTLRAGEEQALTGALARAAASKVAGVAVDELTAHLLPRRFDVRRSPDGGMALAGERDGFDGSLPVLGPASPLVGRADELGWLVAETRRALAEHRADVMVIGGEAGAGKSRLRREALLELARVEPRLAVWSLRGDPSSAPAPFASLRASVVRLAALSGASPIEDHRRLLARLARHLPAERVPAVARAIGALAGMPFAGAGPDAGDAVDPIDRAAQALGEWLRAEAVVAPIVVSVEDAQWVDEASLRAVVGAVRASGGHPVTLWLVSRPEGVERVDAELARLAPLRLTLHPLPTSAMRELVTGLLGERATEALVRDVVERALGNPLLAEELVRGVLEGWNDGSARTVLALVEARLLALPAPLSRVLRAGAMVGQVFQRGAVVELLGDQTSAQVDAELDELVRRDWLVEHAHARLPGERELAFRHPVLRDAAEAALSQEARLASHRLVARWLERVGEPDEARIAAHFARAGAGHLAATHYARAANHALLAGDPRSALEATARGLSCGPDARVQGWLRILEAQAHELRYEPRKALAAAREAERLLRDVDGAPDDRHLEAALAVLRAGRHLGWLEEDAPDPGSEEGRATLAQQLATVEARATSLPSTP